MKRILFLLLGIVLSLNVAIAKDIKTLVFSTNPQMHCENCEKKIKNGLKFTKGIKDIQTSVEKQTVTIKYDADKVSKSDIVAAFKKINYSVTEVKGSSCTSCRNHSKSTTKKCKKSSTRNHQSANQSENCCKKNAQQGEKSGCCKEGAKKEAQPTCTNAGGSCCK